MNDVTGDNRESTDEINILYCFLQYFGMINPSRRFAISLAKRINPRQCRGRTYASKTAIYADEAAKLNVCQL